jgi:hypothetical protein
VAEKFAENSAESRNECTNSKAKQTCFLSQNAELIASRYRLKLAEQPYTERAIQARPRADTLCGVAPLGDGSQAWTSTTSTTALSDLKPLMKNNLTKAKPQLAI